MAAEKVVVDASVVVKWFLEEEHSGKALLLRDKFVQGAVELLSPSLMPYEVLNALRYSNLYSEEELIGAAESLEKYGIELWDLRGRYCEEVVRTAVALDITLYDASYVALAKLAGAKLVTADQEVVNKARRVVGALHIRDVER